MSYAVRRIVDPSTAPNSSGDPPPPTTATVIDYSCLFTHDLRRKQKRWQDGRFKYHTFNKRIMVYDDRGNFIGDAHWHGAGDLQEDEELELDRGAAIVQVGECTGSREQDLTEILDKRVREVEKRRAMAAAKTPTPSRARTQPQQQQQQQQREHQPHFQLNHRPLSSVVPSPGPIGRAAISDRSPYEARKAEGAVTNGPPAKKRRVSPSPPSKAGFAQSLFGARLNLGGSGGTASVRMRALKERTNLQRGVDGGEKRPSLEEDEEVVIVDERRSKVVVKKAKRLQEPTLRDTIPRDGRISPKGLPTTATVDEKRRSDAAQSSRQPNVEFSGTTVRTVERRSRLKINQNKRHSDEELLVTTAPTGAEDVVLMKERPTQVNRNAELSPIVDDSELSAMHADEAALTSPVGGRGDTTQMEKQTLPAAAKPQAAMRTTTGRGMPQPSAEVIDIQSSPVVAEPQQTAHKEPKQKQKVATSTTISKPHRPASPSRRTERRAELRIKPRRRRGLLMLSERKQEQQRQPASVTPTSGVHSAEITGADNDVGPPKSPILQGSEPDTEPIDALQDLEEGQTIEATPEPSRRPCTESSGRLDSHGESDKPTRPKESSWENAEAASDSDQRTQRSRKKQPRSPKRPANDQSSESESDDLPPRRTRRIRRKATSGDHRGSPADEDEVCYPPPKKTRKTETRRAAKSSVAEWSSEEDVEQQPARQPKRTRSKRDSVPDVAEKSKEPKGPRITKMARKSVKCKEIFGFVLPPGEEELTPAPFAMATGRIGTVGRPPAAPPRLPGISLTIKPIPVVSALPTPELAEKRNVGTAKDSSGDTAAKEQITRLPVEEAIHDDPTPPPTVVPGSMALAATEVTVEDSVPKQSIAHVQEAATVEQTTLPKTTITNPATRGKKEARKEDAAGPAPQTIVPFEAPQHVRPSRNKPPEPKKSDQALPGFASANGGVWSKHAEDLLGMTRPTGKKGSSMTMFG